MFRYSYTSLKTFEDCKYLYKLKYIDYVKYPFKNFAAFLGDVVHKSLDRFSKESNKTKDNLYSIYRKIYVEEAAKLNDFFGKESDGFVFLDNYYNFDFSDNRISYLKESEHKISVEVEDITLNGIVDRLYYFDRYYILDFKTNSYMVPDRFQIYYYSYLFYRKTKQIADVIFLFLKNGKFDTFNLDEVKYKQVEDKILRIHSNIQSEKEFKPNYSFCRSCFFKKICDKYQSDSKKIKLENK